MMCFFPVSVFFQLSGKVGNASVGTVLIPWLVFGGKVVLHHPVDPGISWKSNVSGFVEVKIIDPAKKELTEVGDVGALVYKGPGVIAGYFRNPGATQKNFTSDDFFRTEDQFQIRENGYISFYERSKDIVIRGEYNISSQEIENYLMSHPKIQEVAVVSMTDEALYN